MENKKVSDKVKEKLQPFLGNYTEMLLKGLEEDGIIRKIKNPKYNEEKAYELVREVKEKISIDELPQQDNKLIKDFLAFKDIIIEVYRNLKYENHNNIKEIPLSKMIKKFEDLNVFSMQINTESRLIDLINNAETLLNEQEIEEDAIRLLSGYNFNTYINTLLEFYIQEKARLFFKNINFKKDTS